MNEPDKVHRDERAPREADVKEMVGRFSEGDDLQGKYPLFTRKAMTEAAREALERGMSGPEIAEYLHDEQYLITEEARAALSNLKDGQDSDAARYVWGRLGESDPPEAIREDLDELQAALVGRRATSKAGGNKSSSLGRPGGPAEALHKVVNDQWLVDMDLDQPEGREVARKLISAARDILESRELGEMGNVRFMRELFPRVAEYLDDLTKLEFTPEEIEGELDRLERELGVEGGEEPV